MHLGCQPPEPRANQILERHEFGNIEAFEPQHHMHFPFLAAKSRPQVSNQLRGTGLAALRPGGGSDRVSHLADKFVVQGLVSRASSVAMSDPMRLRASRAALDQPELVLVAQREDVDGFRASMAIETMAIRGVIVPLE